MKLIISAILFVFTFLNVAYANEVNLFTSRHYDSDVKLYQKFTAKTGIKVNVVSGKAKALEKRLISEGKSSKADVYITVDAGALGSAKAKGISYFKNLSANMKMQGGGGGPQKPNVKQYSKKQEDQIPGFLAV